jgi:hypothetical protein
MQWKRSWPGDEYGTAIIAPGQPQSRPVTDST